jgi:hypothetical protein
MPIYHLLKRIDVHIINVERQGITMTTKDRAKLIQRLERLLAALNAAPTPYQCYAFTLDTPLGELGVTFDNGAGKLFSIFCRFAKPKLAAQRFPGEVNSTSGKWNHHYGKGYTVESIVSVFAAELARTRDARSIAVAMEQWQPSVQPILPSHAQTQMAASM